MKIRIRQKDKENECFHLQRKFLWFWVDMTRPWLSSIGNTIYFDSLIFFSKQSAIDFVKENVTSKARFKTWQIKEFIRLEEERKKIESEKVKINIIYSQTILEIEIK